MCRSMQLDHYPVMAFIFWISIQIVPPHVMWITSMNLDQISFFNLFSEHCYLIPMLVPWPSRPASPNRAQELGP